MFLLIILSLFVVVCNNLRKILKKDVYLLILKKKYIYVNT